MSMLNTSIQIKKNKTSCKKDILNLKKVKQKRHKKDTPTSSASVETPKIIFFNTCPLKQQFFGIHEIINN